MSKLLLLMIAVSLLTMGCAHGRQAQAPPPFSHGEAPHLTQGVGEQFERCARRNPSLDFCDPEIHDVDLDVFYRSGQQIAPVRIAFEQVMNRRRVFGDGHP